MACSRGPQRRRQQRRRRGQQWRRRPQRHYCRAEPRRQRLARQRIPRQRRRRRRRRRRLASRSCKRRSGGCGPCRGDDAGKPTAAAGPTAAERRAAGGRRGVAVTSRQAHRCSASGWQLHLLRGSASSITSDHAGRGASSIPADNSGSLDDDTAAGAWAAAGDWSDCGRSSFNEFSAGEARSTRSLPDCLPYKPVQFLHRAAVPVTAGDGVAAAIPHDSSESSAGKKTDQTRARVTAAAGACAAAGN